MNKNFFFCYKYFCTIKVNKRKRKLSQENQALYFDDGRQLVLRDVYFAVVHEIHHNFEIGEFDVLEYNDWMLAGVDGEERLKVRAARGKDDLVCL